MRRIIKEPIEVTEETLAVDLIDSVGIGGNFLNETHTATHFRDELFLSPLFSAQPWEQARNQPDLFELNNKANQIAKGLWKRPEQPAISHDKINEINKIVDRNNNKCRP